MKINRLIDKIIPKKSKIKFPKRDLRIVAESPYFDAVWYKRQYKDLSDKDINFAKHYLEYGALEGRNPGPQFHTNFYLESYPDVREEGINPLIHYILHGEKEGRKKWIDFDEQFYVTLYPQILNQGLSPLEHFVRFGKSEGRRHYFDINWYLNEYPEIKNHHLSPIDYYIRIGHFEAHHPAFDSEWYNSEYPESRDFQTELAHYRAKGKKIGYHAAFDAIFYAKMNPDLASNDVKLYEHYKMHGRAENRAAAFSRTWYSLAHRDIGNAGIDAYKHFMESGRREGRPIQSSMKLESIQEWGDPNVHSSINVATSTHNAVPYQHSGYNPKVSIVVPNYNHEPFLRERLDSIYNQDYKNYEVLLLDDNSTDNSRNILEEYAKRYEDKTECIFNQVNSGGVFKQWAKGLKLATGDLIWIAESDDFCEPGFLSELVKFFRNRAIMLAFCRTDFVSGVDNSKVWTSEQYWAEAELNLSTESFVMPANELVSGAWGIRNIAANVSSVIFRNVGYIKLFDDEKWLNLRMCGDWVFYLTLIQGGLVGYSSKVTNYYRQHPNNTSINTHSSDLYYLEHKTTAEYINRLFAVTGQCRSRFEEVLYNHWRMKRGNDSRSSFEKIYNKRHIELASQKRLPNIAIATFAIVTGGGETFPILIANLLKHKGYPITFINFEKEETNNGVLSSLRQSIPILDVEHSADTGVILSSLGVELVHSHHAWVDLTISTFLKHFPQIAHVITTHGMYELQEANAISQYEYKLRSVDHIVYIADKNLRTFSEDLKRTTKFTKIYNSIEPGSSTSVSRTDLNLKSDDFVVCLASRAIPEKGWQEAIDAVTLANSSSQRNIHLLLIGDGPEYRRLSNLELPSFISVLGFRTNVRQYYALSDLGLIASTFRGESCPIVLIECLSVGKPLLTSNIGEVKNMLLGDSGSAGKVFELEHFKINIPELCECLVELANDRESYDKIAAQVPSAFVKFNHEVMISQYEQVYKDSIYSVAHSFDSRLRLSVILVCYNMSRELPRTIRTLSEHFQKFGRKEYEIIVIDNQSKCEYELDYIFDLAPNVSFSTMLQKHVSPVPALNHGIHLAKGDVIAVFIDAARMASPNLLTAGLFACQISPRSVVGSLSYHIGNEPQNQSVLQGYNQDTEDALLQTVQWAEDGYELFKISSFDPSSRFGFFACPAETNALFLTREMWTEYRGFDEAFTSPGGGLVNLDIWRRLCDDMNNNLVMLLGEGTFHQFHGGVATNSTTDKWSIFHDEYIGIRGYEFVVPSRTPYQFGKLDRRAANFALNKTIN